MLKRYYWKASITHSSLPLNVRLLSRVHMEVGEVPRLGGVTNLSIQSLFFSWLLSHERWGTSPRRVARSAVPGNPLRCGKTPLLIQLARRVFDNNYLSSEFSPDIFHQVFGIAIGTPFAVTVANAFMFHHEKDIMEYYSQYLKLYKRFIDDIFAIWCGP